MKVNNLKKSSICLITCICLCLGFFYSTQNTILASEIKEDSSNSVASGMKDLKQLNSDNNKEADTKADKSESDESVNSALPILVSSIDINHDIKSLYEGEAYQLKSTVTPKSTEAEDFIEWSSSNPKVASVDQNGRVYAKNINTKDMIKRGITYKDAVITAKGPNGVKSTCKIRVKVKLRGMSISSSKPVFSKNHVVLQTNKNNVTTLRVNFSPSNAYDKGYYLSYSKKNFSVKKTSSRTYRVTAKVSRKPYSTYFTVKSSKNGKIVAKEKVSAFKVAKSLKVYRKKRIKSVKRQHNINVGRTLSLGTVSYPKSANVKSVVWKSSNPKVATVSSKGVVKGKKAGYVKIRAYAKYNRYANRTYSIRVHNPVKMSWPVGKSAGSKRYNVESFYGGSRGHKGIDIIIGVKSIYPAAKGKIIKKGYDGGWGNHIVIRHPGGGKTLYSHMSYFSKNVKVGKQVTSKTYLGKSGRTGRATCSHLHFEIMTKKGNTFSALKRVNGKDNYNAPFKKSGSKYVYDPDFIWP